MWEINNWKLKKSFRGDYGYDDCDDDDADRDFETPDISLRLQMP